jgi:hypothetical protein
MRSWRRGMIVGIAVAAAVLTPSQDPFTFMAMALPLYLLYEGCIVLARTRERAMRRRARLDPVRRRSRRCRTTRRPTSRTGPHSSEPSAAAGPCRTSRPGPARSVTGT